MPGKVNHIPEGYASLTAYFIVNGAARAIDWYKDIFGATEIMRMPGPDGKIAHAELRIGDSVIMLADENAQMNHFGPQQGKRPPIAMMVYVPDVDATFNKAVAAGATVERAVQDQFYGDRSGGIVDPFGHRWYIATHVEDVTPEEMNKRMAAMAK